MLIDKGLAVGEVVSFKLSGGEEVVARLEKETDEHFQVSKPMVLSLSSQGIGMMPFMFTVSADAKIKLKKEAILVFHNTDIDIAKQYMQSTSSIQMV
jgi:hypothetical protein